QHRDFLRLFFSNAAPVYWYPAVRESVEPALLSISRLFKASRDRNSSGNATSRKGARIPLWAEKLSCPATDLCEKIVRHGRMLFDEKWKRVIRLPQHKTAIRIEAIAIVRPHPLIRQIRISM